MYQNFSFKAVCIWNHLTSTSRLDISDGYLTFNDNLIE